MGSELEATSQLLPPSTTVLRPPSRLPRLPSSPLARVLGPSVAESSHLSIIFAATRLAHPARRRCLLASTSTRLSPPPVPLPHPMSSSSSASTPTPAPVAPPAKPSKPAYQLTPDQLAKQEARKALKLAKAAAVQAEGVKPLRTAEQLAKGEFRRREWVRLPGAAAGEGETAVKVMSWNVRTSWCPWARQKEGELTT